MTYHRVVEFDKDKKIKLVRIIRELTSAGIKDCSELLQQGLPYSFTDVTLERMEKEGVKFEPCNVLQARYIHTKYIQLQIAKGLRNLEKLNNKLEKINRFHF